jgi:hypothetical protein
VGFAGRVSRNALAALHRARACPDAQPALLPHVFATVAGQRAKVLAAQKVIYLDTHAQARWFTNCTKESSWQKQQVLPARCPTPAEGRDYVAQYSKDMPAALQRVCGVTRVVSVFDASLHLATTQGTGFRGMTWDGMHWGLAVNLWKAAGIMHEISEPSSGKALVSSTHAPAAGKGSMRASAPLARRRRRGGGATIHAEAAVGAVVAAVAAAAAAAAAVGKDSMRASAPLARRRRRGGGATIQLDALARAPARNWGAWMAKWNNYRLGDVVKRRPTAPGCARFPNTIACAYEASQAQASDMSTLLRIVQARKQTDVPSAQSVVVHVRIGDGIKGPDCWHHSGDCFSNFGDGDDKGKVFLYALSQQYYTALLSRIPAGHDIILVGAAGHSTRHGLFGFGKHAVQKEMRWSDSYVHNAIHFFEKHGFKVRARQGADPDTDFTFMAMARTFVQGGGGYSGLIAQMVKLNGQTVLHTGNLCGANKQVCKASAVGAGQLQ